MAFVTNGPEPPNPNLSFVEAYGSDSG